jgi:hypothetical protein
MVRSGRGPFKPARPRRARAMHEFFFENLQNPAHICRAGLMRQFSSGQLYSMAILNLVLNLVGSKHLEQNYFFFFQNNCEYCILD